MPGVLLGLQVSMYDFFSTLAKTVSMYTLLAKINKMFLPSYTKKRLDLSKATPLQKAIIGWRYLITTKALEEKK